MVEKNSDQWSYKFGRIEGMRDLILMLEEPCAHGTLCADTSKAMKKDCDICWEEIKNEFC